MANNKVQLADGTVLVDLTDTTATASDVASGKYFYNASGVKTAGTASGGTAAISVVDTTDSHGGTVREITAIDISDTTAVASDVAQGKYFYTAQGVKTAGTASGTPSATAHSIYFEFSDGTDTTITAYYDSTFISDAITATTPTTYGQKTVTLAELDGVEWYSYDPTQQWETLFEDTVSIITSNPNYVMVSNYTNAIQSGETYRVTWGGTVYTCATQADPGALNSYDGWFYGNGGLIGGTDTGEPFLAYRNTSNSLAIGTTDAGGQHVYLKIERQL